MRPLAILAAAMGLAVVLPAAAQPPSPAHVAQQRLVGIRGERGPSIYRDLVARHAEGLDTRLVLAVIRAESNFNPRAVSRAGARGLMQLMPATARSLDVRDSFDPCQNIRGGTDYLRAMLRRFGRLDLALAAYNAGPGAVERYRGIPPFRETRDYVRRVLGFLRDGEAGANGPDYEARWSRPPFTTVAASNRADEADELFGRLREVIWNADTAAMVVRVAQEASEGEGNGVAGEPGGPRRVR